MINTSDWLLRDASFSGLDPVRPARTPAAAGCGRPASTAARCASVGGPALSCSTGPPTSSAGPSRHAGSAAASVSRNLSGLQRLLEKLHPYGLQRSPLQS